MTGKAYFIDGHVEDITSHTFDPARRCKNNEFYFSTESGDYVYSDEEIPITNAMGVVLQHIPQHNFYKYTDQWLVTTEIDHVEFNMEMM